MGRAPEGEGRQADGLGDVEGPCVAGQQQVGLAEDGGELQEARLPGNRERGAASHLLLGALDVHLVGRCAGEDDLDVLGQVSERAAEELRRPVLVGPGRARVDEQQRALRVVQRDCLVCEELLGESLIGVGQLEHKAGLEVLRPDAERRECRHVAADLVALGDVGRHLGHEEEVALVALVDADAARCPAHARQDAREEESLDVECDVEFVLVQQRRGLLERLADGAQVEMLSRLVEGPAVPDEQAVDVGIVLEQDARGRAHEPGHMAVRHEPLEVVDDGCRVQHVADGAEAHDEDARAVRKFLFVHDALFSVRSE